MLPYSEETIKTILSEVGVSYDQYKSDRLEIDESMNIADYMYAVAQNRSLMSSEKSKGVNNTKDTRANVGCTIFHRQVNMLAAQLVNVVNSQTDLVRYRTISNDLDQNSAQDGMAIAQQMQVLSRYTRKKDHFDVKMPEFAVNVFKKSTVFVMMCWNSCTKTLKKKVPVGKSTLEANGAVKMELTEKSVGTKVNMGYPTFKILDPSQVYLDRWIPLELQNCILVSELKNRSELVDEVNNKTIDKDQYLKLGEEFYWDKSDETQVELDEAANRELQRSVSTPKMFRYFNVFVRLQLNGDKIDEEAEPKLYYAKIIGNSPSEGILMSLDPIEEYDPDGEIPIQVVNAIPDKTGEIYHTSTSSIVRSAYSASCTLLNQALDCNSVTLDPPLMVVDGEHRIRNFDFTAGQRWSVDHLNVIKQFEVRDVTQTTSFLREQVEKEAMKALATDAPMMGEFAGSRTSATEFQGVNSATKQPHLVQINYILQQFLPWWGRKTMSYWMYHGDPKQVLQITDMEKQYQIKADFSDVEYDVEVNIVQEYMDDNVRSQQMTNLIQAIGSSPWLQNSETHSTNAGNILKEWLLAMKIDPSRIIDLPTGVDAEALAHYNVNTMLTTGTYIRPDPRSNLPVHLKVARGEEIRWRGLEGSDDPRAAHLPLLQQYIQEIQVMLTQRTQQAPQLPQGQQNQSEGEVAGNAIAAQLGALAGGR